MKTLKLISTFILIILLVSLLSCNDEKNDSTNEKSGVRDTIVITMIAKSSTNPVFISAKTGAIQTAERLSEKYSKLKVIINWMTPENESATEQAKIIKNAINKKTDAIIVSCSDVDTLTEAINYVVDNGIMVMTFDSDAPNSKRFSFYGPDDVELGKSIMNELAKLINEKGKIAILGGNQFATNLQERIKGISSAASKYPGIEIVGIFYHPETEADAIATMQKVQQLYPYLKGWAMVGGWPLFGQNFKNVIKPEQIKIVGVDALPVQLQYIEENYVQLLFGQPTFKWGEVSVETVIDKIYFKKEVNKIIRLKTIPVTIENLGGWARQLKAWGYKNIPERYFEM